MSECRRTFLKRAGCAALGAGSVAMLAAAGRSVAESGGEPAPAAKQWGLVVDLKKCRSESVRQACIEACHAAHNVPNMPEGRQKIEWIWTEPFGEVFGDQVHARTPDERKSEPVLVLCNHCSRPPCTKVCPTGATWKRAADGIVMMDMHRCIGCRYCMAACPYGARSFNWQDPRPYIPNIRPDYPTRTKGVVEKCDFCAERLRAGGVPACVEAAQSVAGGAGALTFGNVADPESAVSRLLRQQDTICRRPSLGTGPSVFYMV